MADGNGKAIVLDDGAKNVVDALKGEKKFTEMEVLKPLAVAGVGGALAVATGRYFVNDFFPEQNDNGQADESFRKKRGAAKIVLGVVAFWALRKTSQPLALGVGVGLMVDGALDFVEEQVTEMLDDLWGDDDAGSGSGSGSGTESNSAGVHYRELAA